MAITMRYLLIILMLTGCETIKHGSNESATVNICVLASCSIQEQQEEVQSGKADTGFTKQDATTDNKIPIEVE